MFKKKDKAKEKLNNDLQRYIKRGEWESVIDCLQQLGSMEPENPTYRLRIGDYYLKLGAKEKAIEDYYTAANLFANSGFLVKALAIYKMILRIDPDDKDANKKIEGLHQHTRSQIAQEIEKVEQVETVEVAPATGFELEGSYTPDTVKSAPISGFDLEMSHTPNIIPLFANMTRDDFLNVVEKMVPLQFLPGEKIVEEGKVGDSIYIISRGRVKVISTIKGEAMELGELGPNDFFGEVSYLTGRPRTATIIALEETEIFELKGSDLTRIISLHDWIKERLEDYYSERVKKTIEKIRNLKGLPK